MTKLSHSDEPIDPRLGSMLELLSSVPPRNPEATARGTTRFRTELEALFPSEPQTASQRLASWLRLRLTPTRKQEDENMISTKKGFAFTTIAAVIVVMAMIFGGVTLTASAAQSSLPGDALYLVKTGLEETQVRLAGDAYDLAQLHMTFAERRLNEISALIAAGRFNDIGTATKDFEFQVDQAIQALKLVSASDPARAASLSQRITAALAQYAQALSSVMTRVPESVKPAVRQALTASQGITDTQKSEVREIEFTGKIMAIGAITPTIGTTTTWTVGGHVLVVTSKTEIEGAFKVGDSVSVEARVGSDGTVTALSIEPVDQQDEDHNGQGDEDSHTGESEEIEFRGEITVMSTISPTAGMTTTWTIGGHAVTVTAKTEIEDAIAKGDIVKVEAVVGPGGLLMALSIEAVDEQDDDQDSNSELDDDDDDEDDSEIDADDDDDDDEDDSETDDDDADDDDDDGDDSESEVDDDDD